MLGQPVALVAGGVGGSSEGDHVGEGIGAAATGADGDHVHDGQNGCGPPFGLTHTGTLTRDDCPEAGLGARVPRREEGSTGHAEGQNYEDGTVSEACRARAADRWRPGT